jgi:hypothetical protein
VVVLKAHSGHGTAEEILTREKPDCGSISADDAQDQLSHTLQRGL